jgi:hypothetical protein
MAEDFYDYEDEMEPRKKDNLFLWTIFILLLIGAAFASWLGSAYVFGHPEDPRCYDILKKMKKIEAPRRFDVTAAPQGEFIGAQKMFDRYSTKKPLELQRENAELLRIFIRNYGETKKVLPYFRGKLEVIDTRVLTKSDIFDQGTVTLLQSVDSPQVIVELLFPSSGPNIEASKRALPPGVSMEVKKTDDVTTVLHVEFIDDGRMLITLIPLHYPPFGLKGSVGTFATEPPAEVNVAAGLPVTKPGYLAEALGRYARLKGSEVPADEVQTNVAPKGPELVRLDTVPLGQKAPDTGALPEPPVKKAEPVRPVASNTTPTPRPAIGDLAMNTRPALPVLPAATPLPVVRNDPPRPPVATPAAIVPPRPAATPPAIAATTPPPVLPNPPVTMTPAPLSPTGVPLKPFNQSNTVVARANPAMVPPAETGGSWRVYAAGTQPRGRTLTPADAAALADQPIGGERVYLTGDFVVRASGDNRAILRPKGMEESMRIIADFPMSSIPPKEGATVARSAERAFEVRMITKASDGTINVDVREITHE